MKNNIINKIVNNKIILFILPHLVYITKILNYYIIQKRYDYYFLIGENLLLILMYFIPTTILYLILNKILKNKQAITIFLIVLCEFYFPVIFYKYIFIIFLILIISFITISKIVENKKNISLDIFIYILTIWLTVSASYNIIYTTIINIDFIIHTDHKVVEFTPYIDNETKNPSIYYIHCDGMMNINDMKKYFGYDKDNLINYFEENSYFTNNSASFIAGHRTQKALVALFSPHYYDNKEKAYLENLENYYLGKEKVKKYIPYKELEEKRINNELFTSFKEKGYTTYAVSMFNEYTALNVDYFYDYFYPGILEGKSTSKNNIELIKDSSNNDLYLKLEHFEKLLSSSIFKKVLKLENYINTEQIRFTNPYEEYSYIYQNNDYKIKALKTSLSKIIENNDNKLVFIDFDINHLPISYTEDGEKKYQDISLDHYLGNYIYSTYLLTDILNIIKDSDQNAIIVVEGDHGIHLLDDKDLMDYFKINKEQVYNIRNSTINAIYVPKYFQNGDEKYLSNPLNITRYLVNNYVGQNYEYINDN